MRALRILSGVGIVTIGILSIVGSASNQPIDQERREWEANVFSVEQEQAWKRNGFDSAFSASLMKDKGYSPEDARIELEEREQKRESLLKSSCPNGLLRLSTWKTDNPYTLDVAGKCAGMEFEAKQFISRTSGIYSSTFLDRPWNTAKNEVNRPIFVIDTGNRDAPPKIGGLFLFGTPGEGTNLLGVTRVVIPASLIDDIPLIDTKCAFIMSNLSKHL